MASVEPELTAGDDAIVRDPRLLATLAEQPYPLLFVTVSGAHLYGFTSPDSDFDLRGVHILPARELLGLIAGPETIESMAVREGAEIDLVTHDTGKYFRLLLRRNGYVLEQIFSPLVVHTSAAHAELREIARGCITRHHWRHYHGFAESEWRLFSRREPRRVKRLLYVYRVLLTGIHLMRSGEVEANLPRLQALYPLPQIPDLIARKRAGPERGAIDDADFAFHEAEIARLREQLRAAGEASTLPETPTSAPRLNDLLLRLRLG